MSFRQTFEHYSTLLKYWQRAQSLSQPSSNFVSAYSDIKIRLVHPANNNTGRVEIFHPSFGWGTVCGDWLWDNTESAGVVCRQMGFAGASAIRKRSYYGRGTGPTLLYNPQCTGKESYIWDCSHRGWNVVYCGHYWDVGVDCY